MAAKKKKSAPKKSGKKTTAKKPTSGAKKKSASSGKSAKGRSGKRTSSDRGTKKRVVRTSKRPGVKRKAPAGKAKVNKGPKSAPAAAPEALALARSIAQVAHEKKAENVLVIDTRARSSSVGYDYVVLASGETDRQLTAIHEGVEQLLKPQGKRASSVEASPDWVCVNYDAGVVAHFFTPDKRDMVDFEGLWKDAPRVSL